MYNTVALSRNYFSLYSVVGGHGVYLMRLVGGVSKVKRIYDCQRPHEVGKFISSTMCLYRYSTGLYRMKANEEFR